MNSTLNIYSNCKIIPSKNFKVDFIENYLATLSKATILDFQYVKHSLQVQIKVDMSQTGLTFTSEFNANYVSIKNGTDGTIVYYFVKNKRWLSEHTIAFDLFMDTINSFNDSISISPKTKILRQHLDRYQKISNETGMVIDNVSEMIFDYSKDENSMLIAGNMEYRKPYILFLDLNNSGLTDLFDLQPTADEYYINLKIAFATSTSNVIKLYAVKKDNYEMTLLQTFNTDSPIEKRIYIDNINQVRKWSPNLSYSPSFDREDYYLAILNDDDTAKIIELDCKIYYHISATTQYTIDDTQFAKLKSFFAYAGQYINGVKGTAKPLIDMYSEGITPKLYGKDIQFLNDEFSNQDWYLIYANQNDPSESLDNPVDCFIVPKGRLVFTNYDTTFSGSYTGSDIANALPFIQGSQPTTDDIALYIHGIFQNGCSINGYMSSTMGGSESFQTISVDSNTYFRMYRDVYASTGHSFLIIQKLTYAGLLVATYCIDLQRKNGSYADTRAFGYNAMVVIQKTNFSIDPTFSSSGWLCTELMGSQYSFSYVSQLSEIDRTNPKIIKCIELPYFPTNVIANEHIVGYRLLGGEWLSDYIAGFGRVLKIRSAEEKLSRQMYFDITSTSNPFKIFANRSYAISTETLKSMNNEPKLFNSDYYQPKFVYDSFGFIFQMELITSSLTSLANNNALDVKFTTTTTINSRFMFTFNDYVCESKELQDYNNIMCISRNNELPLYNQQYINYLRAGYNYDVKNKQRTEAFSWLGAGLSMAGAVASFASSGITGGFGITMGISFTASALGTIANAINTTITQEQNFEIKQKQLQLQTTSVYGSDDVDLMNAYAHNRLKLKLYEVSPRMKQLLFDLFFYTGYVSNTLGLPNTTSRTRFNFVACELVFEQTPNISEEIIDDIKNRYNIGLTFLHRYNNIWDFEQKYENWETALVE